LFQDLFFRQINSI